MAQQKTEVAKPVADAERLFAGDTTKAVTLAKTGEISQVQVNAEAALMKARWGTTTSLTPDAFRAVVMMAREMGMNPVFDLDILGDRLYDTANFWRSKITASPLVEDVQVTRIEPGSEMWNQWIGISHHELVAAAALCEITMVNRRSVVREANYVLRDDAILMAQGEKVIDCGPGAEGKAKADEYEKNGGRIWLGKESAPGEPRHWLAKAQALADDWEGIALKKARTTAMRRAAMMALPRDSAHMLANIERLQSLISSRVESPHTATVKPLEDPFSEEPSQTTSGEVIDGSTQITEEHRRMLHGVAASHGYDHDALVQFIADMWGVEPIDVSTTTLTYDQMAAVCDELEKMPFVEEV